MTRELFQSLQRHKWALILFPLLSFAWLADVLVTDRDLSAFDVILRLPNWKAEYEYQGVQQIILSDSPQAHYPERRLKWEASRQGHRVNYNPYIFSGFPEHAQGVGALVTSPFQFFMTLDEALDWTAWLRLTLAGFFMYLFLARFGLDAVPACLGGVLWAFNLHQIVWLQFPQHLATQLWIPLLFYLDYAVLRHGLSRDRVLGLIVVNVFFYTSGYTQIVLYTYFAVALFNTLYLLVEADRGWRKKLEVWGAVHLCFVVAGVLLIPKVLVDASLIADGLRSVQTGRAGLKEISLGLDVLGETLKNILPSIGDFKRLYAPNYLGGLWGEKYWGRQAFGNIVGGSAYFGVVSLILLPLSLFTLPDRRRRPVLVALLGILLFAFGMAHADPLLLHGLNLIPFAGLGSYGRFVTLILVAACALAAIGLQYVADSTARGRTGWLWLAIAAFFCAPFIVKAIDPELQFSRLVYPWSVMAAVALLVAVMWRTGVGRRIPLLFLAAATVDLFAATAGFNPRMPDERNFPETKTLTALAADRKPFRVAVLAERQFYPPNVLQYYRIPEVAGYSTVAPLRYLEFIKRAYGDHHVTANGMLFLFHGNLDVLRTMNVKYLVSDRELDHPAVRLVDSGHGYSLYQFKDPLPRAYCASDALVFNNDEELLNRFGDLARSHDRPVAWSGTEPGSRQLTSGCKVSEVAANLNNLSFTVATDTPTWLVLPYNHAAGWSAHDETGRPLKLERANYTFMRVAVPAGTTRARIQYQQPGLIWFSAARFALGLVTILLLGVGGIRLPWHAPLLFAAAALMVVSLFEIPGLRNDDVPERPEVLELPGGRSVGSAGTDDMLQVIGARP